MATIRVYSPEDPSTETIETGGLEGDRRTVRTLGLLSNQKPNATLLLEELGRLLGERWPGLSVVFRTKPSQSNPAPADVLSRMRECDAVICGVGD